MLPYQKPEFSPAGLSVEKRRIHAKPESSGKGIFLPPAFVFSRSLSERPLFCQPDKTGKLCRILLPERVLQPGAKVLPRSRRILSDIPPMERQKQSSESLAHVHLPFICPPHFSVNVQNDQKKEKQRITETTGGSSRKTAEEQKMFPYPFFSGCVSVTCGAVEGRTSSICCCSSSQISCSVPCQDPNHTPRNLPRKG